MKKALLIHGWTRKESYYNPEYPTPSNSHWFPWLSKQLMLRDIHAVAIEMPRSYYPEYEIWKNELERFELGEDTILVGHSCGGGFLVRYLSENNVKVGKVVLVAPWLGLIERKPDDGQSEIFDETFFQFEIDKNLAEKTGGLSVMASSDDMAEVKSSIKIITDSVADVKITTLENRGHFTNRAGGEMAFPELLGEILR
ncbi:MAG: alpha/beta hydrolase [Candidatus Nomurabacteria bacterium]|jgi:predicted alpha/beta hydrolase family esterase|nr:alpha/beta hydrolase [Candidatus Nomurabacteria bacterium]